MHEPNWADGFKAFNDWAEGVRHTHKSYSVDPTQYVGPIPAHQHRLAEEVVLNLVPLLVTVIAQLAESDPCRYDHNRDCQAHAWFGLDGDPCPVGSAQQLLAAWGVTPYA